MPANEKNAQLRCSPRVQHDVCEPTMSLTRGKSRGGQVPSISRPGRAVHRVHFIEDKLFFGEVTIEWGLARFHYAVTTCSRDFTSLFPLRFRHIESTRREEGAGAREFCAADPNGGQRRTVLLSNLRLELESPHPERRGRSFPGERGIY